MQDNRVRWVKNSCTPVSRGAWIVPLSVVVFLVLTLLTLPKSRAIP
jgi:hypothetical protein